MLAGMISLGASQVAFAAEDETLDEAVVTGSRVVRDGYQAPTPVSVVTAEELHEFASTNIADALKTLPSITGSVSPETSQVNASSGQSGINSLNLRSIGSGRTLTMVDGQRIVPSTETGLVDANTIPQELVKRVEVVTGGASASWGSDAMGGVVNFILDKQYTGLKASVTAGATNYWDNKQGQFTLTGGTGFADGRGHILFSANASRQDPVILNQRDWNLKGWQRVTNPLYCYSTDATKPCAVGTTSTVPQNLILNQVSSYQGAIGGVIGQGVLMGTAFGDGGVPYNIQEGRLVQSNRFNVGGPMWQELDTRGKHGGQPLASRMRAYGGFMDTTWDLTSDIQVGLMLTRSRSQTANWAFSDEDYNSITIKSGNPFIPAQLQQVMTARNIGSFTMGTMHPDLPVAVAAGDRTVSRAALSLDGKFGEGWKWNAYYQYGISKQFYQTPGMFLLDLSHAYDAVVDSTGAVGCSINTATWWNPATKALEANPGYRAGQDVNCVPYNPMGIGVNSQAAVNYATGNGAIQTRMNHMEENVASASINGTPFSLWAGDVSLAAGAEWRKEWMGRSWVDALSVAKAWWAGNALPSHGEYNVKEAFVETVLPLVKDLPLIKSMDLQAAARVEDYSTTGTVTAWKLGSTWRVVDSLTLRGSRSHDIRAPNLSELYSAGRGGAPSVDDPWQTAQIGHGQTITYGTTTQSVGNPQLKAETSDSWGAGFVFQPTFLSGFGTSVDYWDISVGNAIASAGGLQTIVNNCYAGQTEYCDLITFGTGGPGVGRITSVKLSTVNNSNQTLRGVDAEMSYRFNPEFMPGGWAFRLLGTRYLENSTTNTSGVKTDSVGQNGGNTPKFRLTASADWSYNGLHAGLSARAVSSGVYNNYYVVCSTACPPSGISDTRAITITNNHIPGAVWFDGSVSKEFTFGEGSKASLFLNVRNLLNKDPAVVASSGSFGDTTSPYNAGLYDVMGRVFNAGVRVEF